MESRSWAKEETILMDQNQPESRNAPTPKIMGCYKNKTL